MLSLQRKQHAPTNSKATCLSQAQGVKRAPLTENLNTLVVLQKSLESTALKNRPIKGKYLSNHDGETTPIQIV
ncbi:hypothetical protein RJ641_020018 [Dillenia turbinata]|uniref:Uncharacterized protein n=1 Tax=Dillenia turbinata TaxID=194707 RepID=A0AAN8UN85_9MAGN